MKLMALRIIINQLKNIENCQKLENYLSQEIQKARNYLSPENRLNQEKKLSKSGNLSNFDTKKNKSSFLIPNVKAVFNYL